MDEQAVESVVEESSDPGWDDITLDGAEPMKDEPAGEPKADQPTEENAETTATEVANTDSFLHIKHLDEERDLTREEAIEYAQKGADYDRIRGKLDDANKRLEELGSLQSQYDELTEKLSILEELAKDSGMTVDEMLEDTQVSMMSKKTGKDKEVCRGILANQKEARRLEKLANADSSAKADAEKARVKEDIESFRKAYPEVTDFENGIPAEVWAKVNNGETLTKAYAEWERNQLLAENKRLKDEAEKIKLKNENKARSIGSQSSEAAKDELNPIEAIWNSL